MIDYRRESEALVYAIVFSILSIFWITILVIQSGNGWVHFAVSCFWSTLCLFSSQKNWRIFYYESKTNEMKLQQKLKQIRDSYTV